MSPKREAPQEERPLTPAEKMDALHAVCFVLEVEIEHLDDLLKFEPQGDDAKKRGRYESSGGPPLPTELAQRYEEKRRMLMRGYVLISKAIEKM